MRRILLVVLCLGLAGCALTAKSRKLEVQVTELQETLAKKDEEIRSLQVLLEEKESQLKEKDARIEELRKKLEMFGVFEK